jgi:ribosomal protein L7/L12
MNETLLALLVVGAVFVMGLALARASAARQSRALSRLEAKVDALLKHEGVRFDPYSGAPSQVLDALKRGEKINAIKEYRLVTGVGLKEAKDFVEEIERRASPLI